MDMAINSCFHFFMAFKYPFSVLIERHYKGHKSFAVAVLKRRKTIKNFVNIPEMHFAGTFYYLEQNKIYERPPVSLQRK